MSQGTRRGGALASSLAPNQADRFSDSLSKISWTPTFVGFLAYTLFVVTYKLSGLAAATIAISVALLGLVFQRKRFMCPPIAMIFGGLLLWAALGAFTALDKTLAFEAVKGQAKLGLILLAGLNALRSRSQIRLFTLAFVASFMIFPARAALVNYSRGYTSFGRAVGPFIYSNSNYLAAIALLVLATALSIAVLERRRPFVRSMALATALTLCVLILLTQSRAAVIALVAMVVPTTFAAVRRSPKTILLVALTCALVAPRIPKSVWERMAGMSKLSHVETMADADPEGSAKERLALVKTSLRIIADHPLFGIGLDNYVVANELYSPEIGLRDTHNTYLNLAAETGIPGLALFLVMVWLVLRDSRRIRLLAASRNPRLALGQQWLELGLIGYLIAGFFGSYAKLNFPYIFMTLVWTSAEVLRQYVSTLPDPPAQHQPDPSLIASVVEVAGLRATADPTHSVGKPGLST